MISTSISQAICSQIQSEFYSAHLYLALSGVFNGQGLPGFSRWMRVQYGEETSHALKLYDYLVARGETPELHTISGISTQWGTPGDIFEAVLKHEEAVTEQINALVRMAREEGDYATEVFLHWFVTEQVEEEENVRDILSRLALIQKEGQGMIVLDDDLSKRPE